MENYSLDSQTAPPRHHLSLGNCSTDPTNSYRHSLQSHREYLNAVDSSQVATNAIGSTQEYYPLTYPSSIHQAALAVLQDYDDHVVLAWLVGLRSFRFYENHWFQPGSLSSEQYEAVSVLKDFPDHLVSSWLEFTRSGGAFDGPHRLSGSSHLSDRSSNAAFLHNAWHASSNTSRSSAGSFGASSSPYNGDTVPTSPTSSQSRDNFLDTSRETSIDGATKSCTTGHSHWCFKCPNPRAITTCDGWKRHMKEHETSYRCMPFGPIEYTAEGAKCVFCGFRDPDKSHCDTHKAFPCANKSLDVRSYTRKPHFITHLKTHHNSNPAELADLWKNTTDKKHFSCGFCVSHFHSLIEQLNHIDILHYRRSQDVRDWDSNNVIRGLLLQSGVAESWRRILASHSNLTESLLRWDLSVKKELQYKLEMGNEPADTLAEMAFNESTYDLSHRGEAKTVDLAGLWHHGDVAASQRLSVTHATTPTHFQSNQSPIVVGDTITSLATDGEEHGSPLSVSDVSSSPHNNLLPRNVSDVSEAHTMMELQCSYGNISQRLIVGGGVYRSQPDPALSTPWASSKPPASSSAAPSSMVFGGYGQATPVLNPTNSSSLASNPPRYPSQHNIGKACSSYANQKHPTALGQKVSPSGHSSGLFAQAAFVCQLKKQPSRSKVKDYYDIDTEADRDLDLDILQGLTCEENGTRNEKRTR